MPQNDGTGRISEFEAPGEASSNTSGEQSPAARKTVLMVEKLLARNKLARQNYDKDFVENYKFFRGKQWKEARPAYRNNDVLNFTNAAIQTIIPIMTDSRPNITTIPENPNDHEFSEILNQVLESKWDRDQFSQVVAEAIVDSAVYGTAITEQPFKQELDQGLGDFTFTTVDVMYCYPDERSRDVNDDFGKNFITAIPTNTGEVKAKYPDKAHLIKSDISDFDNAKTAKIDMDDYRIRTATDNLTLVQGDRPQDFNAADQTLVVTAWLDDETMVEEKFMEKDKQGAEKEKFRTKKKYPNGRKIVIANKILLEDEDNPYLDGKYPFARLVDYILPREFWGEGEVQQLKGPNRIINKLWAMVMDTLDLMGNPVWKNPVGSGVFDESIVNKPGLVIPFNEGSEPIRERGTDVQGSVFQAFDRMRDVFDKISGINDVSRGAIPAGMSGVAIEEMKEAAETRIRLKSRNVDAWLTAVGQQFVSRVMQFYTVPRIVRVTDKESAIKYFRFAIDEVEDEKGETQRVATVQNFREVELEDGSKQIVQDEPIQYEIKGNLDVRIGVGTTLPFRKAQKKALAKELYQLGVYDAEDLLTDLELPNKEAVLKKHNERQEAAAQAEAEAAQQEADLRQAELQIKAVAAQPEPSAPAPLASV